MFHHHWHLERRIEDAQRVGQPRLARILPPNPAQARGRRNSEVANSNPQERVVAQQRTQYKCGLCRTPGHTRRSCPLKEQFQRMMEQGTNE
ncbi:hypothetical protein GEMRC1_004218 [Eukaryota sp. GEM-RC1]